MAPSSHQLVARALPADPSKYDPGHGIRPPQSFNNKGYFGLFAILGAVMVLVSIWFFFWAKNGGFHWEEGDWSDYKTTVLRRKDKNGKTLTNATPPTNLGEKSIAGTWDIERDDRGDIEAQDFAQPKRQNGKRPRPTQRNKREPSDEDLRAYRRERSAKVGGINRQTDGSQFASSNASRSDVASEYSTKPLRPSPLKHDHAAPPPPKKGFMEKRAEKKAEKAEKKAQKNAAAKKQAPQMRERERPRHVFAADEASNADLSQSHDAYHSSYRPPAPPHAASRRHEVRQSSRPYAQPPHRASPSGSRQPSPTKPAPARQSQRYPGSFDAYSDAGTSDTGTKVYSHRIPGLSGGNGQGSAGRDRRAMYGGGESDSDEDNDDLAGFRRR